MMFGHFMSPMLGFVPPPPPGSPPPIFIPPLPLSTPPPQSESQLPPSSMDVLFDRVEHTSPSTHFEALPLSESPITQSSSMDVMFDSDRTASPSSTASYSTYFAPSPPTSYHSFSTIWDGEESRPLSPSIFANMDQNGQDMLWHLPQEMQHASSSSDEANDVDDSDEDEDVVFVGEYQRPYDVMPAEGTSEYWNMRLLSIEQRAKVAEERADKAETMLRTRIERTSCVVCTKDFLCTKTLRMPCGHLSCEKCLKKIVNDARYVDQIKCPQCRVVYTNTDNCAQIFF